MESKKSPAAQRIKSAVIILGVVVSVLSLYRHMSSFPEPGEIGQPRTAQLPRDVEEVSERLFDDVLWLTEDIGRRSSRFSPMRIQLSDALDFAVQEAGFELQSQEYEAGDVPGRNSVGVRRGTGSGTVLIGTHYDSYGKSKCANATGSGVAALLEIMRQIGREETDATVIVGFFGTGEKPHYGKDTMGAQVWLDSYLKEGKTLDAAYLIGSFGCFREGTKGQNSAFPWYISHPSSADWVGVYGAFGGRDIVEDTLAKWGRTTKLPARGFAAPHWMLGIPEGDQMPFQKAGIPAVLLSDTGANRDMSIRMKDDVVYSIDFKSMAERVVALTALLKSTVTSPLKVDTVADAR